MKILNAFDEFGKGMGFPSIKDSFEKVKYEGQEQIALYLENGQKTFASTGIPTDVFTGEKLAVENCGMTDGEYFWHSALPYYVRKYNLRLPKDFEAKVLKNK